MPTGEIKYTRKAAEEICRRIASGRESLRQICASDTELFPNHMTVYIWCRRYPEFNEMFEEAKRIRLEILIEDRMTIAANKDDDFYYTKDGLKPNPVSVARDKLELDNLKWMATKLIPKVYGEKITHETKLHIKQESAIDELE